MSGLQTQQPPARRATHRRRGLWVPADEAPYYLAQGWRIIDDGGDTGDLLLEPPPHFDERAA